MRPGCCFAESRPQRGPRIKILFVNEFESLRLIHVRTALFLFASVTTANWEWNEFRRRPLRIRSIQHSVLCFCKELNTPASLSRLKILIHAELQQALQDAPHDHQQQRNRPRPSIIFSKKPEGDTPVLSTYHLKNIRIAPAL